MVGARGFEPPVSWSQTKRFTRLSYAPPLGGQEGSVVALHCKPGLRVLALSSGHRGGSGTKG